MRMQFKDAGGAGADDLGALSVKLTEVTSQVRNFAEDVKKKMEAGQAVSDELKEKADKALAEQAEIRARLDEIEQKMARRGKEGADRVKSWGEEVAEHEDVKAFCAKGGGRVKINVKAITSASGSGGSAGDLVVPDRRPGIITPPERRMTIRDLLTPGSTSSNAVEFVQETGFTNNAAVVGENPSGGKPQSDLTFGLETANVRTIAHFVLATKQIMDDVPMLRSYVDGRLRYGLMYVEETELLTGDGTGQHLHGLIPQATAYSAPFSISGATMIDTLRLAHLQAELAEYPSTGQVLHPSDWARIELTKDGENRYIFANPTSMAGPVLWGRPVVSTQAMAQDDFLVGAFRLGAQIFDRETAVVELSTEDSDNFRKNMLTIRAEERLALAVYRPEAFIYGDFGLISG